MSANTIRQNRRMTRFDGHDQVWLFGYGSLIYKVDFPYLRAAPASITGWVRRFWQASHDHRGTPEAPGRVATLVHAPGVVCQGMAYLVTPAVFERLDHREKNGYLRLPTRLDFADGTSAEGLVYIAPEDNAAFAGPEEPAAIARRIATAAGPSGPNRDYLLRLADALRRLGADDPHVFELEALLRDAPTPDRAGRSSG